MFLISDSIRVRRQKVIKFIDDGEYPIAVLLAAADFERTIRRAILALGQSATRELAHRLGRPRPKGYVVPSPKPRRYGSTVEEYNNAWIDEVRPLFGGSLLDGVAGARGEIASAFRLRHSLIHGDQGTTGKDYSRRHVETLLDATRRVHEFALRNGVDLGKPIKRRIKVRKS